MPQYFFLQYRSLNCTEMDLTEIDTTTVSLTDTPKGSFSRELYECLTHSHYLYHTESTHLPLITTLFIKESLLPYLPDNLAYVTKLHISKEPRRNLKKQHCKHSNFNNDLVITYMPDFYLYRSHDFTTLDLTFFYMSPDLLSGRQAQQTFARQLSEFLNVNSTIDTLIIRSELVQGIPQTLSTIKTLIIYENTRHDEYLHDIYWGGGRHNVPKNACDNLVIQRKSTHSKAHTYALLLTNIRILSTELLFHLHKPHMLMFCALALAVLVALSLLSTTSTALAISMGCASAVGFFGYFGSYHYKPSRQNGLMMLLGEPAESAMR